MRIRNVLLLASTLVLVGCNKVSKEEKEFKATFEKYVLNGIAKDGAFTIHHYGQNLDDEGNPIDKYSEESVKIDVKDNYVYLQYGDSSLTNRVIDVEGQKVYKEDKSTGEFTLDNAKPDNVVDYSTTYGYAVDNALVHVYENYVHSRYSRVENVVTYNADNYRTNEKFIFSLGEKDSDGVESIISYIMTFDFDSKHRLTYEVNIENLNGTIPEIFKA